MPGSMQAIDRAGETSRGIQAVPPASWRSLDRQIMAPLQPNKPGGPQRGEMTIFVIDAARCVENHLASQAGSCIGRRNRRTDGMMTEESKTPGATPPIAIADYLKNRLDPQIAWYEAKSRKAKSTYWWFTIVQFAGTALVPVLNSLSAFDRNFLFVSSGSAACAAFATGFLVLQRPMEHWLRYRNAATTLAGFRTRHAYQTKPFDSGDIDRLLIDMAEHEIATENDTWAVEMRRTGSK